jgi:signal transduction histidine kinase
VSPNTLLGRLTALQVGLAATSVLVFAISALILSARTLKTQEQTLLSTTAAQLANAFTHEWHEEGDLGRAAQAVLQENAPPHVHVEIRDKAGRLLGESKDDALDRGGGTPDSARAHSDAGAWITVSASSGPRRRAISALFVAFLVAALPLFFVLGAISQVLARRVLEPLSRLSRQAAAGDAQAAEQPFGLASDPAEVRIVADEFNRLVGRLQATLRAEQRFTEDAAHELRTPITVVSGELERALGDPGLSPRARDSLTRAHDQAGTMSALVDALLLLRRADEGGRAPFDPHVPVNVADVLREVSGEVLDRRPERQADFGLIAEDEVLVAGNATLLRAAIQNLLTNAFKFTRLGQRVEVRAVESHGTCHVVVEDAGPGVAAADRERIFDAFFRGGEARAEHDGVGLGLAILRRVARAHGGDVTVGESSLGGARFDLALSSWSTRA